MREIILTQDKVAIVDDEDFEWLSRWKWQAQRAKLKCGDLWYAVRREGPRGAKHAFYMHREIAAKAGLPEVDHHDHDGLNNQRYNLRPCNRNQSRHNRRKTPGCSSRFMGVCWNKCDQRWRAGIMINGKIVHLGVFTDEVEAAKAYDAAARCRGEFARFNFAIA